MFTPDRPRKLTRRDLLVELGAAAALPVLAACAPDYQSIVNTRVAGTLTPQPEKPAQAPSTPAPEKAAAMPTIVRALPTATVPPTATLFVQPTETVPPTATLDLRAIIRAEVRQELKAQEATKITATEIAKMPKIVKSDFVYTLPKDASFGFSNLGEEWDDIHDVIVELQAVKMDDSPTSYGVMTRMGSRLCGGKLWGNAYFFEVNPNQQSFRIWINGKETSQSLCTGTTIVEKKSDVIKSGREPNQIKVTNQGTLLLLEVNGTLLGQVYDNTFDRGMAGVVVHQYSNRNKESQVRFNKVTAAKP